MPKKWNARRQRREQRWVGAAIRRIQTQQYRRTLREEHKKPKTPKFQVRMGRDIDELNQLYSTKPIPFNEFMKMNFIPTRNNLKLPQDPFPLVFAKAARLEDKRPIFRPSPRFKPQAQPQVATNTVTI
jgi:hypothetical protein